MKIDKSGVLCLGLVVIILVLVLGIVVPPFQFPDEPHHFAAIMISASGEAKRESIERATIELMERFQWWRLAGVGVRRIFPSVFRKSDFSWPIRARRIFGIGSRGYLLYHAALGWVIGRLRITSLAANYYLARAVSGVFFLLTIFFIWLSLSRLTAIWTRI